MIGIPCLLSSRKNSTIVSTRARKRWERPEGGERAGHRLHHDRICGCHDREKMASICQWCGLSGNISDAFAGVPCLTPLCRTLLHIGFPPSCCLRSHYPPSRIGLARRAVEQESCASRIPGREWLSAHA